MQSDRPKVGCDCSKDEVVIVRDREDRVVVVRNRGRELRQWLRGLPGPVDLAVESTGRYHLVLANLALRLGHTVYVLDPRRVRRYAESTVHRGKTDAIDARVICRFLAREIDSLRPYVPPTRRQRRIDSLIRRRGKLVTMTQQLGTMHSTLPGHKAELRSALAHLQRLIKAIDRDLDGLTASDATLGARRRRLETIVGVGDLNGVLLANLFDRVAFPGPDQLVAFVGLDPRPADSGRHRGRRRITKRGAAECRRLAYNAAKAAARSALWKPYYDRCRARGLSSTEALCDLARRLLRVAWAVDHYQQDFDPSRVRIA